MCHHTLTIALALPVRYPTLHYILSIYMYNANYIIAHSQVRQKHDYINYFLLSTNILHLHDSLQRTPKNTLYLFSTFAHVKLMQELV